MNYKYIVYRKQRSMYELVLNALSPDIYKPIMVYISWMSLHYIAAHLYSEYCTNWSIYGFIMTPFNAVNPLCKGLNWFIYESSTTISNIFLVISTSITLYLSKFKVKTD